MNFVKTLVLVALCYIGLVFCSTGSLGGWEDGDVNDAESIALAKACVQEFDKSSNSLYLNKLLTLKSVQYQVVAGMKYKFLYDMGESTCFKNDQNANLEECDTNGNVQECSVVIWLQPWMKTQEVLSNDCIPRKSVNKQSVNSMTGMEESKINGLNYESDQNINKMQQAKKLLTEDYEYLKTYDAFMNFKSHYNKQYTNKQEELMRFHIYKENMKKVDQLRSNEKGSAIYGATQFADMSEQEFRKTRLTPTWNLKTDPQAKIAKIPDIADEDLPTDWDWRNHSAVSEVKNQGSCGSCWAFSTTGNVEGQYAIKNGKLLSLSEQELVDCDKVDQGCNGGLPVDAYKAIMKLGGLETESDYPYEGDDEKCSFQASEAKVKVTGYLNISSNEDDMARWLYKNGPISIGINAMAMQFYFGGVSHPFSFLCDPETLDHGVLIVGYGVKEAGYIFKSKTPYWIIKNSWGPSWGESGYYLVYRGAGVCGLNQMPTSAEV